MKALYIIACCMFIAAIACQVNASRHVGDALAVRAKALSADESGRAVAKQEGDASLAIAKKYTLAGAYAAVLGIVLWVGSWIKGRRTARRLTPVWPLVLLIAYVMLNLVMV